METICNYCHNVYYSYDAVDSCPHCEGERDRFEDYDDNEHDDSVYTGRDDYEE